MIFDRQNFANPEEKRTTTHTHTHIKKDEVTNKQTNSKGERGEKEGGTVPKMRTGQLSSVGNYRGARSELQSGQDPASKRQKVRERERKREREREGEERRGRCDLYPDIRRNSGKRYFNDFQTRSMEDPG